MAYHWIVVLRVRFYPGVLHGLWRHLFPAVYVNHVFLYFGAVRASWDSIVLVCFAASIDHHGECVGDESTWKFGTVAIWSDGALFQSASFVDVLPFNH